MNHVSPEKNTNSQVWVGMRSDNLFCVKSLVNENIKNIDICTSFVQAIVSWRVQARLTSVTELLVLFNLLWTAIKNCVMKCCRHRKMPTKNRMRASNVTRTNNMERENNKSNQPKDPIVAWSGGGVGDGERITMMPCRGRLVMMYWCTW